MSRRPTAVAALVVAATVVGLLPSRAALQSRLEIPRAWSAEGIATFELPLASARHSPVHVPTDYYYQLPVRPVYRSYPIYHPDREPAGYQHWLREREPEVVFDETRLVTDREWVDAGALVFEAPMAYRLPLIGARHVRDSAWYRDLNVPLTKDGVMPFARWVVRSKGRPEVGNLACSMCHIRVMPDGTALAGAQGNFPFDRSFARDLETTPLPLPAARGVLHQLLAAPWVNREPILDLSRSDLIAALNAVPPGVLLRQGTSLAHPAKIPDLIGIRDRKYLDATGLVRHRDIGDLMRYAAANQAMDMLARYGDYLPAGRADGTLPAPGQSAMIGTADRHSDAQLYALSRYLYSLAPPANPNRGTDLTRRGEAVFEEQQCGRCHTPPLYTNNRIIPAPGFTPPADHLRLFDVMNVVLGTDPGLALTTRRGTGYYKVPSLRGVWYRGPFGHDGAVATLEDWFDPARLRSDYVPTGFKRVGDGTRAVPGHLFGLSLSVQDRGALIAFLRTL
jgi:hypothetical protein